MIREKAIYEFEDILGELSNTIEVTENLRAACKMAIKALEQEPCDDCISRQAVLNEIYNTDGISNIYFCLADKINALLPVKPTEKVVSSSEKPNKWIPVSERLPKTYGNVCATIKWDLCDLSSIAFGCYTKDEGWQLVDTEGNRCYDFTVIAWMPLQPYKEGSDKE